MLSGKPVLASVDEDSSTTRMLAESGAGIAVKPDSIELLKEGFVRYSKLQPAELAAMGDSSKRYARAKLTRDINLKLVVDRIKTITQ